MAAGTVKRYNPGKRYGFISPDDGGDDVLLHEDALCPGEDGARLRAGVRLVFQVHRTPRGLRASDVQIIDGQRPAASAVLAADRFRDEISEVLAGAVGQIESIARKYGWVA